MPEAEKRQHRLDQGLCASCGVEPHRQGVTTCSACADLIADANAARKERLQRRGMCVTCGQSPAREGALRCDSCGAMYRQRDAERRQGGSA